MIGGKEGDRVVVVISIRHLHTSYGLEWLVDKCDQTEFSTGETPA